MGADAERRVFDAIDPDKDVDGFHPDQRRPARAEPRDARGVHAVGRHRAARAIAASPIAGARAVVIGRSDIVGKPMALLLLHRHATVTICHSRTADLPRVAARGRHPRRGDRPAGLRDARRSSSRAPTVVDVGTTPVTDRAIVERLFPPGSKRREAFERRGSIVVGDVHPDVAEVAGALSPVPGGVGPLTIAMLLKNTLRAARSESADGHRSGPGGSGWAVPLARPEHVGSALQPDRWLPMMLKVALTGGIATGKSYVLDEFRRRGVPCLDADALAHGVTAAGTEATAAIAARFGADVLAAGRLRRSREARSDRVRRSVGAARARGDRAPGGLPRDRRRPARRSS